LLTCSPAISTIEIDSASAPCTCASMPLRLMGLPTSMAIVARVTTAGPVPASCARASISTHTAM